MALTPLHSLAFSQFGGEIVFGCHIVCSGADLFKPAMAISAWMHMRNNESKTARYDHWMVDGSPDFGIVPIAVGGLTDGPAPIRLQRGDVTFGAHHIEQKHGHWVKANAASVPELVWRKCRQSGVLSSTEDVKKGKIWLPIHPSSLMILSYVPGKRFWTVVSLYFHEGPLDGQQIGRYTDTMKVRATAPVFSIREFPSPPRIVVRAKRKLVGR